jgi:rhamnose transport system substrate-binding protein
LTKYPNLRGILCPTVPGLAAAAQEVETMKAANRVQVTGMGMPKDMRQFVKNGTIKKFSLWDPVEMGYLAGRVAGEILSGKLTPAPGVSFKAGTLGSRTFKDKNKVILGPPLVFDKSNIDKFKF